MDKEIADKWVKALRSGEYQQGKFNLCDIVNGEKKYCCLGVLCDILKVPYAVDVSDGHTIIYQGEDVSLPENVKNKIGMKSYTGYYGKFKDKHNLSSHNDNGKSFKEIADIIERNWETL